MAQGWVALLRGINLGARNRVPMAGLRDVVEQQGCERVRTHIASGNVLFEKAARSRTKLAADLEAAVAAAFGVEAAVVLRTFDELATVAAARPLGEDTDGLHVTFLVATPSAAAVKRLRELDIAPDEVAVVGSDVYLRYPNGVQGARLGGALLERTLGIAGTARNWRTVTKLAELAGA